MQCVHQGKEKCEADGGSTERVQDQNQLKSDSPGARDHPTILTSKSNSLGECSDRLERVSDRKRTTSSSYKSVGQCIQGSHCERELIHSQRPSQAENLLIIPSTPNEVEYVSNESPNPSSGDLHQIYRPQQQQENGTKPTPGGLWQLGKQGETRVRYLHLLGNGCTDNFLRFNKDTHEDSSMKALIK